MSSTFDRTISYVSDWDLLKGGVIVTISWALWFAHDKEETAAETRRTVLANFAGTFFALAITRILAKTFPFRLRPLHQPDFNFRLPVGFSRGALEGWSSFPSDHASLFIGLATGIFLISPRLGFFSIVYVFLVILIPRIYLGLHHPTDILFGALLGCVCVLLANKVAIKKYLTDPLYEQSENYPAVFHGAFFLVAYETVFKFGDVRLIGSFLLDVVKMAVHRFS